MKNLLSLLFILSILFTIGCEDNKATDDNLLGSYKTFNLENSDKNSNNHGDMNHICPICNPTEIPVKGNNFYIVKHSLNSEIIDDKTNDNDNGEFDFVGKKID
jgi:hypothetical protein|tara:strand:+ start:59 stop:367 length:309 start_codon:yes stop_codon:yes gene_type:complete